MTLARQGRYLRDKDERRERAFWESFTLSALTGEPVTPGQLLGEETQSAKGREKEANRKVKAMERKLRKAGFAKGPIPVQLADSQVVSEETLKSLGAH